MAAHRTVRFVLSYVLVGIVAAAAILVVAPGLLAPKKPVVVELRESTTPLPKNTDPEAPASYADAVAKAAPAVVNIYSAKHVTERVKPYFKDPTLQKFFGNALPELSRQRTVTSLGSGVIVSKDGYILTNNHVIAGAEAIEVMTDDGRQAEAKVVGTDPETDLAVLKVNLDKLPVITLGQSDKLRVGDVVLAIGNPFGVGQTVTQGIVSATGRSQLGLSTFENFIQTDAAINPGNSGGALINAYGQLIGINTAIFSRSGGSQGIGFAIPISLAKGIMTSIIEHGRVIRGWLGVQIRDLTPGLAQQLGLTTVQGAAITAVYRDGPAAEAGMRPGDVVMRLDGQPVADAEALLQRVAAKSPGSDVTLEGLRGGQNTSWRVKIGERPPNSAQTPAESKL